ncbi:deoxynucleotidyltransferase terminal-interacting protein 2 [Anopheles bellator]|uniref:deoxynucleotidyltransferase terminal-interacting protein 2 n=1 Tax=Anopheles bellator TaxID=139047 RepID=UPI0026477E52|nr:deoxynucleotidyltransferase terminal-interacting protein 2 [Anopheles bellator]
MDLFVLDTVGDSTGSAATSNKLPKRYSNAFETLGSSSVKQSSLPAADNESDEDDDYDGLPPPGQSISEILNDDADLVCLASTGRQKRKIKTLASLKGPNFRVDVQPSTSKAASSKRRHVTVANELNTTDVDKELRSSVLSPAIEKSENLARLSMSDKKLQHLNRLERQKTKGKSWFDLPAPEMTTELKNQLELIQMRSVLDPKKSFGRAEKIRKLPKYFQIGTVANSPLEYYNERGVKKVKSQSLVDELLADAEFQKFNKRKYAEALEIRKKKAFHKAAIKMKKLKKKKK